MKKSTQFVIAAGVAAGLAFVLFRKGAQIARAVNPADRENVIYQSVGEPGLSIADWFGGLFKSDAERKVDRMLTEANTQPLPQAANSTSMSGGGKITNSWDTYGLL